MRQCDYHLCDKCESQRREEMKEIEKIRKLNILPSTSPTGLDKYAASHKYPKRKYRAHVSTPLTSGKPKKTTSTGHWTVTENPDKNSPTNSSHKTSQRQLRLVEAQIMLRNPHVLIISV